MSNETQDKTQPSKKNKREEAKERFNKILLESKNSDTINYEEFETFADMAKEFIVKTDLVNNKERTIYKASEIIKRDREGFFNMLGFITNTNPEVLKALPMGQLMDYFSIFNNFLQGVRLFDFFTCTTTILTRLIVD